MQILRSRPRRAAQSIVLLPTDEIAPNPCQPRQVFDGDSLASLADSIRRYGVLNPISVRQRQGRYELVAGERRLRAARLAGLDEVPCVVLDIDGAESGAIALVENLQREDLDFAEQARGLSRLITQFGLTQEECARRIGLSQSAVANKLRLLKLSPELLDDLRQAGLTERHARALLRLPDEASRRAALVRIVRHKLSAAETDRCVDALLERAEQRERGSRSRFVLKDVRVFLNTLQHSVDLLRRGGVDAALEQVETEDGLLVTILIRRQPSTLE